MVWGGGDVRTGGIDHLELRCPSVTLYVLSWITRLGVNESPKWLLAFPTTQGRSKKSSLATGSEEVYSAA